MPIPLLTLIGTFLKDNLKNVIGVVAVIALLLSGLNMFKTSILESSRAKDANATVQGLQELGTQITSMQVQVQNIANQQAVVVRFLDQQNQERINEIKKKSADYRNMLVNGQLRFGTAQQRSTQGYSPKPAVSGDGQTYQHKGPPTSTTP